MFGDKYAPLRITHPRTFAAFLRCRPTGSKSTIGEATSTDGELPTFLAKETDPQSANVASPEWIPPEAREAMLRLAAPGMVWTYAAIFAVATAVLLRSLGHEQSADTAPVSPARSPMPPAIRATACAAAECAEGTPVSRDRTGRLMRTAPISSEPALSVPSRLTFVTSPEMVAPEGGPVQTAILQGLPQGSALSEGSKISDTAWALAAQEVKEVILTLPNESREDVEATIEIFGSEDFETGPIKLRIRREDQVEAVANAGLGFNSAVIVDLDLDRASGASPATLNGVAVGTWVKAEGGEALPSRVADGGDAGELGPPHGGAIGPKAENTSSRKRSSAKRKAAASPSGAKGTARLAPPAKVSAQDKPTLQTEATTTDGAGNKVDGSGNHQTYAATVDPGTETRLKLGGSTYIVSPPSPFSWLGNALGLTPKL